MLQLPLFKLLSDMFGGIVLGGHQPSGSLFKFTGLTVEHFKETVAEHINGGSHLAKGVIVDIRHILTDGGGNFSGHGGGGAVKTVAQQDSQIADCGLNPAVCGWNQVGIKHTVDIILQVSDFTGGQQPRPADHQRIDNTEQNAPD